MLDQVRITLRTNHYSPKTEESYTSWIKQFIDSNYTIHLKNSVKYKIQKFINHLAVESDVASSTLKYKGTLVMFYWFISQNTKSIKRSPDFSRKLIVNIIFSVLMLLMALDITILGIFLIKIIKEHFPDSDPVVVFNGGIIFYIISETIFRLVFQKIKSLDGNHISY